MSTDVGGMRELITDRVSGRLVPKGDDAALAEALSDVLDSPEIGRRYAEAAIEDLRARFSSERMFARLAEIYGARDA